MDHSQCIVLNETEVCKVFWPAERNIKFYLNLSGSNSKALVVYDCCREDMVALKERVYNAAKFQLEIESIGGQEF